MKLGDNPLTKQAEDFGYLREELIYRDCLYLKYFELKKRYYCTNQRSRYRELGGGRAEYRPKCKKCRFKTVEH